MNYLEDCRGFVVHRPGEVMMIEIGTDKISHD
jgi:hypothetical protein